MFILLINAYMVMVIYTRLANSCIIVLPYRLADWIDT